MHKVSVIHIKHMLNLNTLYMRLTSYFSLYSCSRTLYFGLAVMAFVSINSRSIMNLYFTLEYMYSRSCIYHINTTCSNYLLFTYEILPLSEIGKIKHKSWLGVKLLLDQWMIMLNFNYFFSTFHGTLNIIKDLNIVHICFSLVCSKGP